MKLHSNSAAKGFTIIEIVLVMGILVLIFAMGVPVAVSFYLDYQLTSETRILVAVLSRARNFALVNYNESNQGVRIDAQNFVIFPLNHEFPRAQAINVSGPTELVFEALSGRTTSSTFTLNDGRKNKFIYVNEEGRIQY